MTGKKHKSSKKQPKGSRRRRRGGFGPRVPADARPPVVHEPRRVLEAQTDVVLARVLAQPVFFLRTEGSV